MIYQCSQIEQPMICPRIFLGSLFRLANLFSALTVLNTGQRVFLSSLLTLSYFAIHHKYLIKNREIVSTCPFLSTPRQISQGWATWIHIPVVSVPLCSLCCDSQSVGHSVPDVRLKQSTHTMTKLHFFSCWQGPVYALPGRVSTEAGQGQGQGQAVAQEKAAPYLMGEAVTGLCHLRPMAGQQNCSQGRH